MKRNLLKDNRGVFGMTAVQMFFSAILMLGILAYIIVIIMGSLGTTTILPALSTTTTNESMAWLNGTTYTLTSASTSGFTEPSIIAIWASIATGYPYNYSVALANASVSSAGVVTRIGTAALNYTNVSYTYTYNYNSGYSNNLNSILGNTSNGVSGFFSSISPVYAILAVLVIILILVVLVRVVQSPNKTEQSPAL